MAAGALVAVESGYLLYVAHKEHVCGCRRRCGGVVVLALQVGLYRGGCGAYCGVVGINYVGDESFTFLPLHKTVQLALERAVRHDEVAHRCCRGHTLGV